MRSKLLINLILLPSFISITSCNPFTKKDEQDFNKLYLGGYQVIQASAQENERAELYDYYIYVKFCLKNQVFDNESNFDYDLEIDLNTSDVEYLSTDSGVGFYEIGKRFSSLKGFSSYSNLKKFLEENYISVFTSIGKYSERYRIVSKKFRIDNSGYAFSFSSISSDLESLRVNYAPVYVDKLYLFDTIKF